MYVPTEYEIYFKQNMKVKKHSAFGTFAAKCTYIIHKRIIYKYFWKNKQNIFSMMSSVVSVSINIIYRVIYKTLAQQVNLFAVVLHAYKSFHWKRLR